jgi:hypothetical protein
MVKRLLARSAWRSGRAGEYIRAHMGAPVKLGFVRLKLTREPQGPFGPQYMKHEKYALSAMMENLCPEFNNATFIICKAF